MEWINNLIEYFDYIKVNEKLKGKILLSSPYILYCIYRNSNQEQTDFEKDYNNDFELIQNELPNNFVILSQNTKVDNLEKIQSFSFQIWETSLKKY